MKHSEQLTMICRRAHASCRVELAVWNLPVAAPLSHPPLPYPIIPRRRFSLYVCMSVPLPHTTSPSLPLPPSLAAWKLPVAACLVRRAGVELLAAILRDACGTEEKLGAINACEGDEMISL